MEEKFYKTTTKGWLINIDEITNERTVAYYI